MIPLNPRIPLISLFGFLITKGFFEAILSEVVDLIEFSDFEEFIFSEIMSAPNNLCGSQITA
jgi:hypothetical protein